MDTLQFLGQPVSNIWKFSKSRFSCGISSAQVGVLSGNGKVIKLMQTFQ